MSTDVAREVSDAALPGSVRVVNGCAVAEAAAIVRDSEVPVLFRGMIDTWPARSWVPETFATKYGDVRTLFRVHRRPNCSKQAQDEVASADAGAVTRACDADSRIVWEGDCTYCHATFSQFFCWAGSVDADASATGALAPHRASECFAYADYKYMHQLFAGQPDALAAVDWTRSFGQVADGADSTLWLGSRGAWTQCHQDSYGANLVAQLYGSKRWTLFPPSAGSRGLYPTRVPYEQSSVFSRVAVHNPDLRRHPQFQAVAHEARSVTLEPGEVLFVPKHWWHDVQTISDIALSVNHWVQLQSDGRERVKEALVAVLTAALRPPHHPPQEYSHQPTAAEATQGASMSATGWLNPGEEQVTVDESAEMLSEAIAQYHSQTDSVLGRDTIRTVREVNRSTLMFAQIVNAFGTGGALEAATDAILGIGPTQQTLATVAQVSETELSHAPADILCTSNQHAKATSRTVIGQQNTQGNAASVEHRNWFNRTLRCSQQRDVGVLCVEHLGGEECEFLFDEIFTRQAYLGDGWLKLPSLGCTSSATVVDCGANIGLFSLWCVSQCRDAAVEVVAIEPAPPCCAVLRRNLAAYTVDASVDTGIAARVHVVPCGLVGPKDTEAVRDCHAQAGTDMFCYDPARPGETHRECYRNEAASQRHVMGYLGGTTRKTTSEDNRFAVTPDQGASECNDGRVRFRVQTRTLSSLLWGKDGVWPCVEEGCGSERKRIDMLKIDVEGDELEVLRGISAADWHLVDQVVLEVHDYGGVRLGEVVSTLKSVGFVVRTQAQRSSVSAQGYLAVIPSGLRLFYVYARRDDQPSLSGAVSETATSEGEKEHPNAKRPKFSAV